jgi:hypothetical protein
VTLLFLDLETVTLDPKPGSVWEIGWADLEGPVQSVFVIPDLTIAQAKALEVGRFGERYDHGAAFTQHQAADLVRGLLDDRVTHDDDGREQRPVIVGSAPWFDADHLAAMFGHPGRWHHHHDDMPARAAGALGLDPPTRLKDAATAAGFDTGAYEAHTAAGDVELTRDLYRWWKRHTRQRADEFVPTRPDPCPQCQTVARLTNEDA